MSITDEHITKIVSETVTKMRQEHKGDMEAMREFHLDDMKVMREYMDVKFESVDRRFDALEQDMSQVKSALQALLEEFQIHREKVVTLEREVSQLRSRVATLEAQLQTA